MPRGHRCETHWPNVLEQVGARTGRGSPGNSGHAQPRLLSHREQQPAQSVVPPTDAARRGRWPPTGSQPCASAAWLPSGGAFRACCAARLSTARLRTHSARSQETSTTANERHHASIETDAARQHACIHTSTHGSAQDGSQQQLQQLHAQAVHPAACKAHGTGRPASGARSHVPKGRRVDTGQRLAMSARPLPVQNKHRCYAVACSQRPPRRAPAGLSALYLNT